MNTTTDNEQAWLDHTQNTKNMQRRDFRAERNGVRGEIYEAMTCNRLETWSTPQRVRSILPKPSRTKAIDSDELVGSLMRAWLLDISSGCLMGLCRLLLLMRLMVVAVVLRGGLNLCQLRLWWCTVGGIGHTDTRLLRLHLICVRGMLSRMVHRLMRLLELTLVVQHVTRHHRHHRHVHHWRGNRRNARHVHIHRKHHGRRWGRHARCGRRHCEVWRDR